MDFIKKYQKLFWDTDISKLDLQRHKKYIIEKVLDYGDFESVNDIQGIYSIEDLKDVIINTRNLSKKTANYWRIKLHIEEPIRCLQMQ